MELPVKEEAPKRHPLDVLEETTKWGYNMISLVKRGGEGSGQTSTIAEFAKELDVSPDHPRYDDIRIALLQISEFYRTVGIMGSENLASPDVAKSLSKSFVSAGSGIDQNSQIYQKYAGRINSWPADRKIELDFGMFATVFSQQLKAKGIDDIAQKAQALASKDHGPSNNGATPQV